MSQVDAAQTGKPTGAGVALLRGRIAARRSISTRDGRRFLTVVKLPAPDEFTSPQTVEILSSAQLGEVGDTFAGKVQIGGFGRSYQAQDPETGDKRTIQTADVRLTAIEG